jgi:starch synthase
MRLLMVTPELSGVLESGGIAEGVGALVRELAAARLDVTVALPAHRTIDPAKVPPHVIPVDAPLLRDRPDIYGPDMRDEENGRRFAFFARAVVDLVRTGAFDVVHAHEWPCAMVPYLLREEDVQSCRTVLTIHNIAHQGIFPIETLDALGLGKEHAAPDKLLFPPSSAALPQRGLHETPSSAALPQRRLHENHFVNFLQGGILAADVVSTVSPTYAREILNPPRGELLEQALRRRAEHLIGLTNGVDGTKWNPRTDPHIAAPYSADDPSGKERCKQALALELGLPEERPIVVSVGRVVEQKGSDLLAAAIGAIVGGGASVVVAGSGDIALEAELERAARAHPAHARYLGRVPDAMVHRLIAGADLLAMPSRFEPCGIVQLYALRYGTIPVAARTGGLVDTIEDATRRPDRGTGFLYDAPTADGLVAAVGRALETVPLPAWNALRRRAMLADHSWRRRALAYRDLYQRLSGH